MTISAGTDPAAPVTGDPMLDALVPTASRLVWAVRCGDVDSVDQALIDAAALAGGHGWGAIAVLLAAMVPDDRAPSGLLAWLRDPATYLELRHLGLGSDAAINAMRCCADFLATTPATSPNTTPDTAPLPRNGNHP